jgi:FkbM family methyltransferase
MTIGKTTIRMTGDIMVSVPGNWQLMTNYVLREQEDWFEDEIRFLRKLVRPGMRIIDIGANYGLYSLSLARLAGASGSVIAVEPCAATASYLRESVGLNHLDHVTVVQLALSNKVGTARLKIGENSELNTLAAASQSNEATEEVDITTLDRLAADYSFDRIDFLKVDAEGEEERIIAGGRQFFLTQSPLVMYEVKSGETINHGLIEAFSNLGYESYQLVPGLDVLCPLGDTPQLEAYQLNLFCCKPDRAEQLEREGVLATTNHNGETVAGSEHWWRDELSLRPFARAMRDRWMFAPHALGSDLAEYFSILALYGAAHDRNQSASMRYQALRAAYEQSSTLRLREGSPFQLSTYARIAREMGERMAAVSIIGRALQIAIQADPGVPVSPFLPASEHFDDIEPAGRTWPWLVASLLDQGVVLSTFSTYFSPPETLQSLEVIKTTGFQRNEMERRRQLMRMRSRLQHSPEPDSGLARYHAGNLNPGFWMSKSFHPA